MKLPPDLLDRPSEEASRLIALVFLDQARAARRRLDEGDPEGLHDFRVSIRRIRTALRAFPGELEDSVSPRSRRELRRIARATGRCRDLEVHAGWVAGQLDSVTPRQRAGIAWLLRRLARRRRKADRRLQRLLGTVYPALRRRLKRELSHYEAAVQLKRKGHSAARTIGARIRRIAGDLETRLLAIRSIDQSEVAHQARIRVKRLRYLLDPLPGHLAQSAQLDEPLQQLQDALGELQDAVVYEGQLGSARKVARREQARRLRGHGNETGAAPDPRPGLVELSRRLALRKEDAFDRLAAGWLKGGCEPFFTRLHLLAESLLHPVPAA
jgi:CHAD domain-containing protein